MSNEDLKILAEDLCAFLEILKADCTTLQTQIAKLFGPEKAGWDPAKIKWQPGMGVKGPFEYSEDINNPEFKAMLKTLAAHNGRMNRNGTFYWTYHKGDIVGRKKV